MKSSKSTGHRPDRSRRDQPPSPCSLLHETCHQRDPAACRCHPPRSLFTIFQGRPPHAVCHSSTPHATRRWLRSFSAPRASASPSLSACQVRVRTNALHVARPRAPHCSTHPFGGFPQTKKMLPFIYLSWLTHHQMISTPSFTHSSCLQSHLTLLLASSLPSFPTSETL